jgi:plastocyanin
MHDRIRWPLIAAGWLLALSVLGAMLLALSLTSPTISAPAVQAGPAATTDVPIQGLAITAPETALTGQLITFTASVTAGDNITFSWDFGDGGPVSEVTTLTATHTYTAAGAYTITLMAENDQGTVQTDTVVLVGDAIVDVLDNFYDEDEVTVGLGDKVIWLYKGLFPHSVTADDDSFDQPAGTDWPPFTHTFTETGVFDYFCTVHVGLGMTGTVTVVQDDEPIEGLDITAPGGALAGSVVTFTASITAGTNVSFTWDFGDGQTGSGMTVTHVYSNSGNFTATLTAENNASTEQTQTVMLVGNVLVDTRNFVFDEDAVTIDVGERVVWVRSQGFHSVTADDGSFEQPASNSWPAFMHTFTATGVYSYFCEPHLDVGMVGSVTVESDEPIAGLTATNNGPKLVGSLVNFTAAITAGTNVSYSWDFGDGGTGSGISATHTYTASGVYTATVTAENDAGLQEAQTVVQVGDQIVQVRDSFYQPKDITVEVGDRVIWVLNGALPHSVTADDSSFNQPAGTNWPPFMHTFDEAGVAFMQTVTQVGANPYYCTVHGGPNGVGMAGSVTVQSATTGNKLFIPRLDE